MSKLTDILSLPRFYVVEIDGTKSLLDQVSVGDRLKHLNHHKVYQNNTYLDPNNHIAGLNQVIEVKRDKLVERCTYSYGVEEYTVRYGYDAEEKKFLWTAKRQSAVGSPETYLIPFLYVIKEF